ncbi:Transcription factor [Metarhizium rileyi]|uniref:Transcription factor n=1 Tax=Metarhizium rileyi (strain RCEF 4871) TaxID=1649241 RepID=A0A167KH06_METRR|nr:Transcription factor [Metarhizium rileyi RCEF 4871]
MIVPAEPLSAVSSDACSNVSLSSSSPELLTLDAPFLLQIEESDGQDADQQLNFSRAEALDILLRVVTKQPQHSPSEPQAIPRSWLTARIESYLASFHQRWPILHAPSINELTDSVQLISLIVMIDSWLHGGVELKSTILQIHDCLVQQLQKELNQSDLDPSSPWPVELYQLSLLNVVFAFETGRDSIIRQSRMLFSLLVTALRLNGCFHGDAIQSQRLTHHPGDFKPFIFATVESWKRIATCALKLDTYLSLLYGQPPLLRRDELELGLTSTFAMWNSYGIMVFFDRSRSEPWSRDNCRISQLNVRNPEEVPFGVLPEDIQLYLLGMWNDIRSLKKETSLNRDMAMLKKADLSQQLYLSLEQLETIAVESRKPLVIGGYTATVLKSYLGCESSRDPNWRQKVTNRLDSCISNIRPLLLLLTIHLHADIHTLSEIYLSPVPLHMEPTAASQAWQQNVLKVQDWAMSADGRTAAIASLQTWLAYESSLLMDLNQSTPAFDPIVYLALSAAAIVLWSWTMNDDEVCICHPSTPKVEVTSSAMYLQPDVQNWIPGGGGGISSLGQPVCKCTIAQRLSHWTEALAKAGRTWELASEHANTFRCSWLGA